ncbi:MAG: hypothetical protein RMK29_12540 [Myxococcales bacterium]|nr:hypothetical protein [Myxococcota bacterium]MDW8282534.1 hypothetical protein [Myxococcales bacterium]
MRAPAILLTWAVLALGCTVHNDDFGSGADLSSGEDGPGGSGDLGSETDANGHDGNPGLDSGTVPDGATGLSCRDIRALVTANLANSTACRTDEECVVARTECGLPGECGDVYVNKWWRTEQMESLLKSWVAQECGPSRCICPGLPQPEPACINGKCGPKRPMGGGIGAACTRDADCATGQCITEAQDRSFVGGYCTVRGCNERQPCPAGSSCVGVSGGMRVCLAHCMKPEDCRKGYACCPGLVPLPPGRSPVCAPERSALCLSR